MKRRPLKLKVASPCNADWDKMSGTDAIRHCSECDKNVYHLSHMTTEQVEQLLNRAGAAPCVRFYERADGTVLLGDCPVGQKSKQRRRMFVGAGVGAAMLSAVGLALAPGGGASANVPQEQHKEPPCDVVQGGIGPESLPTPPRPKTKPTRDRVRPRAKMGAVAATHRPRPHMGKAVRLKKLPKPAPKKGD